MNRNSLFHNFLLCLHPQYTTAKCSEQTVVLYWSLNAFGIHLNFLYGYKVNPQPSVMNSFIRLACAEFDDSLPFSGASSLPLYQVLFPATLLHRLFFHHLSPRLAIYFLAYLSILFPNSYLILFLEFYFLPFSVHVQTNVIYLTLSSLLWYNYHVTFESIQYFYAGLGWRSG